ncbi:hypothetical protein PR048_009297 [Dryococelus australis]|uniref:Retroviral polymerase SH3-like domain-containing protein n=1 Tax=Dryococelus australis TaxID=614101 RepID=A0ABQ9I0F5_9NEOP|nr:hypothetical protein PR048_009297 [Dryococelus australis]
MPRQKNCGSRVWIKKLPVPADKFEFRATKGRMAGYDHTGYRIWIPETDDIVIGRDVKFYETNQVKCVEDEVNKTGEEEELEDEVIHDGENLTEDKQTSCGRSVKSPLKVYDCELYTAYALSAERMPQTYEEAMQYAGWKEAINNEL